MFGFAGVTGVHAHHVVGVAEAVAVDVGGDGGDLAQLGGPGRCVQTPLAQRDHALFREVALGGRGAQRGDRGEHPQTRGFPGGRGVGDEALAEQPFHVHTGDSLSPPGAQQLAEGQLGVQRVAHGEQRSGRAQHFFERCDGNVGSCGRGRSGGHAPSVCRPAAGGALVGSARFGDRASTGEQRGSRTPCGMSGGRHGLHHRLEVLSGDPLDEVWCDRDAQVFGTVPGVADATFHASVGQRAELVMKPCRDPTEILDREGLEHSCSHP